jgi:hypothetical protein
MQPLLIPIRTLIGRETPPNTGDGEDAETTSAKRSFSREVPVPEGTATLKLKMSVLQ